MKLHPGPVFIDNMVNSTEFVVHFLMNFVKVIQNQLLFRKPLMLCAKLILQDRHVTYREIETTLGISGISIHSILHEHLMSKKFIRVGSHTISQNRSKKGSCRLAEILPTSGSRGNVKLTYFAINNQNPSKLLKIFEQMTYQKNITLLLYYLNINYCNFCPI